MVLSGMVSLYSSLAMLVDSCSLRNSNGLGPGVGGAFHSTAEMARVALVTHGRSEWAQ